MKRTSRLLIVSLLVATAAGLGSAAFASGPSSAAGRAECREVQSKILGRAVRYCALLPSSFDADKTRHFPIVYFLHGLGENEQILLTSGGWETIEQLREQGHEQGHKKAKIGEFVVVAPDGGRSFFVNSRDGKERWEDFFIQEFMPAVEQRYRAGGTRSARALMGVSMGGYGALRFAFKYPQKFAAVAVHSAALFEDLPDGITDLFGSHISAFGDPADPVYWKENTPLALARKAQGLARLRIYFDCGQQDDYGFDAGAQQLHQILEKRGIAHEFHLYPGGHNWEFVAQHFEASLTFVSNALSAKGIPDGK